MTEIKCNCADVPPSMPKYRTTHLIDCPVRINKFRNNPKKFREEFDKAQNALAQGIDGVVEYLKPSTEEEAHAAYSRGPGRWAKACMYCKGYPQFKECYCDELEDSSK